MLSSFPALLVAVIGFLPGAAYTFAYEREAGSYGQKVSDRLLRFLVASAVFHALASGYEFAQWQKFRSDEATYLSQPWWHIQIAAIVYLAIPAILGWLVGRGAQRDWPIVRWLVGEARHPRSWDFVWSRKVYYVVRARLKSGDYIAGAYATLDASPNLKPYASGHGEDADLYLPHQLQIDAATGELVRNDDDSPVPVLPTTGILVRWEEVEAFYVQPFEPQR